MTNRSDKISQEDVLNAFSVEPDFGRSTLERYLRQYPHYAEALVDLSYELNRHDDQTQPLSDQDHARIDDAWRQHASNGAVTDVLGGLTVGKLREIATILDVPRQVLTAFRERAIMLSSVPKHFLVKFATALEVSLEALTNSLLSPPAATLARSFKADGRPTPSEQVTFEQALVDAGVSEEGRSRLLRDDE